MNRRATADGTVLQSVEFSTGEEKADFLDAMARFDARIPKLRRFAGDEAARRDPNDRKGLAETMFAIAARLHYVNDPRWEEFSDAWTALERGWGDCDDKSRVFVALCTAVGLEARIRPVFDHQGNFTHVQGEVRWPGSIKEKKAQPGGWILAEFILRGSKLGDDPDDLPRDAAGRRVLY